jgi:two-component system sensor histidine kinase UhpB
MRELWQSVLRASGSLRWQIIALCVLPTLYLFASVVWYAYSARDREVREELRNHGQTVATALADRTAYALSQGQLAQVKETVQALLKSDPQILSVTIYGDKRQAVLHEASTKGQTSVADMNTEAVIRQPLYWVSLQQSASATGAQPATLNQEKIGTVRIALTAKQALAKRSQQFSVGILITSLALLVSMFVVTQLSGRLTNGLEQAMQAIRAIRQGERPERLVALDRGELGELQQSINQMSDSLDAARHRMEALVAERTSELEQSRNDAWAAREEIRHLLGRMHEAIEQERQSIAVEIHDELNASLVGTKLLAQRIVQLAQDSNPQSQQDIVQLAGQIVEISRSLYANGRQLVQRLRPEVLEVLGLAGALEEMLRVAQQSCPAMRFEFQAQDNWPELSERLAISAYRIAQEALSNTMKYAQAKTFRLHLHAESDQLLMQISDDGCGFEPGQASQGIGLAGMRERVMALQGGIQITATKGAGCQIRVSLPLQSSQT